MIGQEEKDLVNGLLSFLPKNPMIFDIGANKGHWSDIFFDEYGEDFKLHIFEPNSKLLSYCEIKYEYKKNVVFNDVAVYREVGEHEFYYFENFNNELSSLHYNTNYQGMPMKLKTVPTTTINSYCHVNKIDYIDFLKADIEGGEFDLMLGCIDMLMDDKIRFIQIEYGGHYQVSGNKFGDIIRMVNNVGYSVYSYSNGNYNRIELDSFVEDYHYENYIITKEEIHNYSTDGGWLKAFRESVEGLPKFNFAMEIGSYEGLTAKYMCQNMLEDGGRMIVVDPLKDYYTAEDDHNAYPYFKQQYQRWLRNTKGLPIELFREDSRSVLPRFTAFRFDFIFVDGNHEEDVVYRDATNCWPIMHSGSYLLFDDYDIYTEGTKRGIDCFLSEHDGQFEIIKKGYQLLIRKN